MALSIDLRRDVEAKLSQWGKESSMHFCRLAQRETAQFTNVVYPTGLKMVRVHCPRLAEAAEVPLSQAKQLRRDSYTFRAN